MVEAPTPSAAAVPAAPSKVVPNTGGSISQSQLEQALSAIGVVPGDDIDLGDVLNPEGTLPLLKDLLADDAVRALLCPHLPAEENSDESIAALLRSAQFKQTLRMLATALKQGHVGSVLSSMGLSAAQAGPAGGVQSFLRAIQAEAGSKGDEKDVKMADDDDSGDDMYGTTVTPKKEPDGDGGDDDMDEDLYG